jgi:Nucleotidyltransferase domain
MLLMPGEAGRFRWGKLLSRAKLALRWVVVATAQAPLSHFYRGVYRAHVWYALRVAKKFKGTRAVYITRSMATGTITIGISDIDLVIVGEWPEEEQIRLMRSLGALTAISPLYDSGLWQQVYGVANLRELWETDYFFQSRFNEGRTQWKLAYGEDIIASLPPVPPDRLGGGFYMEVRSWWLHFIASTFGSGPTAKDAIFRNSIAYKAVTEIATIARTMSAGGASELRAESLRMEIEDSSGATRDFLERLEQSARRRHLGFDGDIQEESLRFLLPVLDQIHAKLGEMPSFEAIGPFRLDANSAEVLRTPSAIAHAHRLIDHVKQRWQGYQGACLAPSAAAFALDDLLLLINVNPRELPSLSQMRELTTLHAAARETLRQRISIYLLLPAGACQLEFINFTEMWRVMVFPPSTPDLFTLIQRPEFLIDGQSATLLRAPAWSRFASDLAIEERNVRRSVLSKVTPDVFPSSIEIIRNVYRHLQLEVLTRTSTNGNAVFALSPAAIERELRSLSLSDGAVLDPLRDAYARELQGETSNVRPLIPQIMSFLQRFS